MRALVIHEDRIERLWLSAVLEQIGWAVDECDDGWQGAATFDSQPYDLVIADQAGLHAAASTRGATLQGRWPDCRIITVSPAGHQPSRAERQSALLLGADKLIVGPIDRLAVEAIAAEIVDSFLRRGEAPPAPPDFASRLPQLGG